MKKTDWLRMIIVGVVLLALLVFVLYKYNAFVFDDSATIDGNAIVWNGARYVPCEGKYTLDAAFAKMAGDDARVLYAIEGDDDHRCFVAKAMRDPQLYIREDMSLSQSGKVTGVYIFGHYETDPALLETLNALLPQGGTVPPDTEELLFVNDFSTEVIFCFDDCPIGTDSRGMLSTNTDIWIAAQFIDNDVGYGMLTEEQTAVVKPFFHWWLFFKTLPFVLFVTAVITILIIGIIKKRKRKA